MSTHFSADEVRLRGRGSPPRPPLVSGVTAASQLARSVSSPHRSISSRAAKIVSLASSAFSVLASAQATYSSASASCSSGEPSRATNVRPTASFTNCFSRNVFKMQLVKKVETSATSVGNSAQAAGRAPPRKFSASSVSVQACSFLAGSSCAAILPSCLPISVMTCVTSLMTGLPSAAVSMSWIMPAMARGRASTSPPSSVDGRNFFSSGKADAVWMRATNAATATMSVFIT
mmetsp:Transcript_894/g.1994  ORF Transcript_894/g.1994 Transcript_894/m.1994 type:complete len:232 (+) Transcript_894:1137-1832(+)